MACPDCGTATDLPRCADCTRLRKAALLRRQAQQLLREADGLDGQTTRIHTHVQVGSGYLVPVTAWDRMDVAR